MGIFRRISDGLCNPSNVLQYRTDRKLMTLLMFFVLALVLMIPNFIEFFAEPELIGYDEKVEIRNGFFNREEIPYKIIGDKLLFSGTREQTQYYVNLDNLNATVCFTTQEEIILTEDMNTAIIMFKEDAISLKMYLYEIEIAKYSDYQYFEGLDFTKANDNNRDFWQACFKAIDEVMDNYHSLINSVLIVLIITKALFTVLILSLLLTLINRLGSRNIYTFGVHWKLMIYYFTPFAFGICLATLFNMGLFEYLGLFLTFIYSMKINQINFTGGNENEL